MKMVLINPPSPFLIDEKVFPNLGLISLATSQDLDIIDFASDKDYKKNVGKLKGDLFGFSSTTPQFPYVYEMFHILKKNNPKAKFVKTFSSIKNGDGGFINGIFILNFLFFPIIYFYL